MFLTDSESHRACQKYVLVFFLPKHIRDTDADAGVPEKFKVLLKTGNTDLTSDQGGAGPRLP